MKNKKQRQAQRQSGEKYFLFVKSLLEMLSLIILVVIPVFFLPNINSVFTIAKVSLLHFLVSILVGIWLFNYFAVVPHPSAGSLIRSPLQLMTLVLAAIYLMSTLISIFPIMSFWGSYMRREGIYTIFSFMLFSLILSQTLRNRDLGKKMLFLLLLGSGLASIYGIFQHFWLDPLFNDPNLMLRIMSTAGNPLFLSIYLAMLIPFAISTIISSLPEHIKWKPLVNDNFITKFTIGIFLYFWRNLFILLKEFFIGPKYLYRWLLGFLLLLNLTGFWFSQSRGPVLGLAVGLVVYAALYAMWKKKIPLMVFSGLLFIILSGVIVFFSVPGIAENVHLPLMDKSRLFQTDQLGSLGAQSRFVMWKYSIKDLLLEHPSIGFKPDRWNILRPLLGYGPEGMDYAFARVFPPELVPLVGRGVLVDRAHNRYIDMATATGFLGVTALLVLIAFIFTYSWKWLKKSKVRENQFIALAVMSTIVVWMVDGIFGINTVETALFFWSIVALVGASSYWEESEKKKIQPKLMITEHLGGVVMAMIAMFFLLYTGIYYNLTTLRADYNMRQGIELTKKPDQLNKASEAFAKAAILQPRWSIYSNYLARSYFRMAQSVTDGNARKFFFEQSAKALKKARETEPLAYTNYSLSGYIYSVWADQVDKSKWDEALNFYSTTAFLSPHIPAIYDDWAISLDKAGQHAKALEKVDYALSLESDYFQRHILKALILFNVRDNEKAIKEMVTATKMEGSALNQFSEWSSQLKAKGVLGGFVPQVQEYAEKNPDDWIGHQMLAIVYMDSNNFKAAIDEVNKSLSLVPAAELKAIEPTILSIVQKKIPPEKLLEKK